MSQFIGIFESALSPEFCRSCIDKFEASDERVPGRTGQGVDPRKKVSTDLTLDNCLDRWSAEMQHLQRTVLGGLISYVRAHPFLLAGAVALQHQDPQGKITEITAEAVKGMDDATLSRMIMAVYRLGTVNLQKYDQGKGGYFHWHSEFFPHPTAKDNHSLHRVLLWMFFLNDVTEGGETEFYYQNLRIRPKQGTLVIAPATFTHTHRGAMPVSGDKYIFTSWVLYQTAEQLYGG